jgi:hypothetical protein
VVGQRIRIFGESFGPIRSTSWGKKSSCFNTNVPDEFQGYSTGLATR